MDHNPFSRLLWFLSVSALLFVFGCLQSPVSWSPDGKRVAFIQVRQAPGEKQLPQLSNGKHLAELWVADVESGQGEIIDAGQGGLSAPAWSPDGRTIAYLRIDVKAVPQKTWEELYRGPGFRADVVLYDVKTKEKRVLCETFVHPSATTGQLVIYTASLQPAWSPDGRLLAFDDFRTFSFPNVMVADMSGKKRVLAQGCAYPRWSPDGKLVACVLGLPVRLTYEKTPIKIVLVKPDSGVQRMIDAVVPPQGEGTYWGRIAWAPDSRRIAYVGSTKNGSADCSVFVAKVEGEPERLASGDKERIPSNPAWGPDPGSITVRWSNEKACRIVTLDVLTKRETLFCDKDLRNAQYSISATALGWSPDGKWLAHRWYGGVVRLLSKDGSTQKALLVDPAAVHALVQANFNIAEQAYGETDYEEARRYAEKAASYADVFLRRYPKGAACASVEDIQVLKADSVRLTRPPQHILETLVSPASDAAPGRAMVRDLGKKGDDEAVGKLVVLLFDPDSNVREDAEAELDALDPQWRQRAIVEEVIRKMGPPMAATTGQLRQIAAEAFGKIRHRSSIAPLVEALRSYNPEIRQQAAKSLDRIDSNWRQTEEARKAIASCLSDLAGPNLSTLLAHPERCRFAGPHIRPTPKDDKALVRGGAAHALGELRAIQAVEPLITALKDQDPYVRHSSAQALGKIGDRRAVGPLIVTLKDEDWFVPAAAALAVGEIKDPKAVDPLIDAFNVKDSMIALRLWPAAATALGQIGDRRAIGPLVFALGDYYARQAAEEALNKIDPSWHTDDAAAQAVPELLAATNHWQRRVREEAVKGLCRIRNRQAFEAMLTLARKGRTFTKEAAEAYGKMGAPWIIEPLLEEAKGTNYGGRRAALQILQHTDDHRAIGALINIMGNSSLTQQEPYREAKKVLDEKFPNWRSSEAAKDMVKECAARLNDPDKDVRYWASIIIKDITEPGWRDKTHGKPRSGRTDTIELQPGFGFDWRGADSAKKTIQESMALLKDKDWKVRIGAIVALGKLRAREAVPALIELAKRRERRDLGDAILYEQWSVRAEAIVSLGMIGDPRALDVLIDILDSEPNQQRAAATALTSIPDRRAVEPLIRSLSGTSSSVREMAARALGTIRDPRAVTPLIGACRDDEWEVRDAATKALAAIGNAEAEQALLSLLGEKSEYTMHLLPEYAGTLVKLDHPSLMEALVGMLKHYNKEIRHGAALVLEKKKDRRAIGPLVGLLADKAVQERPVELLDSIDPNWRTTQQARDAMPELIALLQKDLVDRSHLAAKALGEIRDHRAVEPLIDALTTSSWSNVKEECIKALGEIGDSRAIEPLIRLIHPTYPSADNELVVAALKKVTGQDFGIDRKQWKIWWAENKDTFRKE